MSEFQAPSSIEYKAALTATEQLSGFNNHTMIDRSFRVPVNRGAVTHLGLFSTVACSWRPKLVYDSALDGYNVFYSHPTLIAHGGTGWEWVQIPRVTPNGAMPVYVAGYFGSNPSTVIAVSPGPRSEKQGDVSGIFAPIHGDYSTPALGARVAGIESPVVFFTDFNSPGIRDGCGSVAHTWSVQNGVYTTSDWNSDDNNHIDGIGMLSLLIYINRLSAFINGTHHKADLRNARVVARVRGVNYDPKQSQVYPWIQGRHPNDLTKSANWAMTGMPLNDKFTSGDWETIDIELDTNPALWTYAGNNAAQPDADRYSFLPLADTFVNGENFHFPAVRAVGTPQPTGTIEWDYLGITYADVS